MSDGSTISPEGMTGARPLEASPVRKELAQATGRFYNSLLDVYLSKTSPDAKQQKISELVGGLPVHARDLYTKGIDTFQEELKQNHALLQQHRGEEAKYLVSCVMKSEGNEQEKIDEVLNHITPDQARFIEPTEGAGIIQLEHELYEYLARKV